MNAIASTALGACHICAAPGLEALASGFTPIWITSDFRPWDAPATQLCFCPNCGAVQKNLSPDWHLAIDAIYTTYDPYPQGKRMEQASFAHAAGTAPMARSEAILRQAIAALDLSGEGRMLDIGCGDGSLIASFGRLRPGWRLNAADLGEIFREQILALPGVEAFHRPEPAQIPGTFDLVTMVHVFEHIVDPVAALRDWAPRLGAEGKILIQVPNLGENPFDLMILDHATHFTLDVLTRTIRQAGFEILIATDDWVAKELTVIAKPRRSSSPPAPDIGAPRHVAKSHLAWLDGLAAAAARASEHRPFGIFGTAIAGSWLFQTIEGHAEFFVDEDPNRIGGTHFDRPILAPAAVDPAALVLVPLPPVVATRVGDRLSAMGLTIILPPPLDRPTNR